MAEPLGFRHFGYRAGYLGAELKASIAMMERVLERLPHRHVQLRSDVRWQITTARQTLALVAEADKQIATAAAATLPVEV